MTYTDGCPNCGSNDYTTNGYGDDFDMDKAEQWWDCTCNRCGQNFTEHRFYKLVNVCFETED